MENENLETQTTTEEQGQDVETEAGIDAPATEDTQTVNEYHGAPESYDYTEITMPEGMTLDQEILDEFNPIAKKFNLSQKAGNELMGLAVKLVQKQATGLVNGIKEAQEAETAHYKMLLNNDKEIGSNKAERDAYLSTANIGYAAVAPESVKAVLAEKGLSFHPEIIKMFHSIGQLCVDDKLPNVNMPTGKDSNPADVLYGDN
jgi:hypothetical protein